jgi:hypothetical protein
MCLLSTTFPLFGRCDGRHRGLWTPRPFEAIRPMVTWECPTNPREASGFDPEAVHYASRERNV